MNRNDLFLAFNEVDDDSLVRSEMTLRRKKVHPMVKWGLAAACMCLILACASTIPRSAPIITPTQPVTDPILQTTHETIDQAKLSLPVWDIVYNNVSDKLSVDAERVYIPGYFTEILDITELNTVLPGEFPGEVFCSGTAGYDGDGNLLDIHLTVAPADSDDEIFVIISKDFTGCGYIMPDDPIICQCGEIAYTVYQYEPTPTTVVLEAEATIGEYQFHFFTSHTSAADLAETKIMFEKTLGFFSLYKDGNPDFSTITPNAIPEWFDRKLTLSEALADPLYGSYMLSEIPSDFKTESIRRYKNQHFDYLSGLWTSGYDQISWRIYSMTEADSKRITSVSEKENYDLSLYPIPRADSVPEELHEIVDNPIFLAEELTMEAVWARAYKIADSGDSGGWRMAFSVKYGDIIIEVRTKGVDPQWIYDQLIHFIAP